jgi:hypothetical protein
MRSDMGRVVIERPRSGSSHKSPKIRHFFGRIDPDGDYDGLTRLPSSRYKIYGFAPRILEKSFTDVLGPLRRYLHKNVGRPWDKVYGEAKKVLQSGGWGVQHVFDTHFLGEVDRQVYLDEEGRLWSRQYRYSPEVSGFYVHPKSGLLRYAAKARIKREPRRRPADLIALDDGRHYVRIRDLWFIARYEEFVGTPAAGLDQWPNIRRGGELWICRVEKSCNKKDLREIKRVLEI